MGPATFQQEPLVFHVICRTTKSALFVALSLVCHADRHALHTVVAADADEH
jgi:hypothetical protein